MAYSSSRKFRKSFYRTVSASCALLGFIAALTALQGKLALAEEGQSSSGSKRTLEGRWRASPLTVQWVVGSWGKPCGPRPSGGGEAGGIVNVTRQGAELKFSGAGRSFTTANCWERYQGLERVSHRAGARSWSSVCRTSPSDPRRATVRTTIRATDNTISFDETGQYQFIVKGQNCTASTRRTRTYQLIQRAGEKPQEDMISEDEALKSRTKPKKASARCLVPGPAHELRVSPSGKLMRPGDEFTFRAAVKDARGCRLSKNLVRWELREALPHVKLHRGGRVEIAETAPESEIELLAKVGSRALDVTIQVVSQERYDGLLAGGAFDGQGESTTDNSLALGSSSIGAATAVAENAAATRKAWFAGLSATLALLIAGLGFITLRQGRRRSDRGRALPEPSEVHPVSTASSNTPETKVCPTCGTLYSDNAQFCGRDGTSLVRVN